MACTRYPAGLKFRTPAFLATLLMIGAADALNAEQGSNSLRVLSNRPDAISGGDALVEFRAPPGSRWIAELDGHEVTASFRRVDSGEWVALLTGLKIGKNALEIRGSSAVGVGTDLINHPLSGP